MNFLAHLLLADPTPASRVGNLLPDLHRGRLPDDLTPEVRAGIDRHRRVDAFTDRHPIFERTRSRLRPKHGRYSGIIADVLYDYVLSVRWNNYSQSPREEFIAAAYSDLNRYVGPLPIRVRAIHRMMADEDWLGTYATVQGIELTLTRLSHRLEQRFGRRGDLASAAVDLPQQYEYYAEDFAAFFPELCGHVGRTPPSLP
jgi:acyl carrier protein phosphodiesterase